MTSILPSGLVVLLAARLLAQQPLQTRFVMASVLDQAQSPVFGLTPGDFIVEENGARRDVLEVRPANYPIAVLLDTSAGARQNFMQMRKAVADFAARFSGRPMSLTTFGDVPSRVVSFSDEGTKGVATAVDGLFARPDMESHVMDGMIQVAKDLQKLDSPLCVMVVVSAGGMDQSRRAPVDVLRPVLAAHTRVEVRETRSPRAAGYLKRPRLRLDTSNARTEATQGLSEFMRAITERTGGRYELVFSGGGFEGALRELANELSAEVIVEYIVPDGAPPSKDLKVGVDIPGATVRGLGLTDSTQ